MRLLQVTLTTAATPILTKGNQPANSFPFQVLTIQNNSNAIIRVGDYSVSATKGIQISPTGAGSSDIPWFVLSPGLEYTSDLYEWFIFGTAGSVIDVLVLD